MSFLAKGKKADLITLATELGEAVPPECKIIDLKNIITKSENYEEDFIRTLLDSIIEDRVTNLENEAKLRAYELEKLRLQNEANVVNGNDSVNPNRQELRKLMQKYDTKDGDISFYLILFERQAQRISLEKDNWVSHLLGLLPYDINQLIAREPEVKANDYKHVKELLLKRFKLTPERFRQKFVEHFRTPKSSWKDFAYELRNYFEEWLIGLEVTEFEKLKDLIITEQLKKKISPAIRDHFIDEWSKFTVPEKLADKLDSYESVRCGMKTFNIENRSTKTVTKPRLSFADNHYDRLNDDVKNEGVVRPVQNRYANEGFNSHSKNKRSYHSAIRNEKGEPKCFNCNYYGHLARECTKEKRKLNCRNCGQSGHTSKYCEVQVREEEKNQNSLTVNVDDDSTSTNTYLKRAKINSSGEIACLMDSGSPINLLKRSVARQLHLEVQPGIIRLFGIGNANLVSAVTLGKVDVKMQIDNVSADVELFIVDDHVMPYDLIVGRSYLDSPDIAFAKIGKSLHVWYANELPFAQWFNDNDSQKVMLKTSKPFKIEGRSVNFIEAKTDSVENKLVLLKGSDTNLDSVLEIVDGKTVLPIINVGEHQVKFKVNQCVGRTVEISADWNLNTNASISVSKDDKYDKDNFTVNTVSQDRRDITLEDIKFDCSTNEDKRREILDLVNEYRDIFALSMSELGCTTLTEMDIKEVEGSKPVCLRAYKASAAERHTIKDIVKEWKDNGIVSETRSPYASPVLLVKKKTGESRLVVDFRRLNSQTIKDKFPLPRIDDLLERLADCKLFTTLDLAHGYLQIPLTEEAKRKTAFITPDGTGQFERMIFGLANAPAEFQRLMYQVLGSLLNTKALCYLDDILIPARNWEDMIERLKDVFKCLRSANLTLKVSKCEFGKKEVDFLGFVINSEGLKPGPRKIRAIEDYPEPKSVHDVRRFIGLTSFFRRFVKNYARKAEPLTRLTRKNEEFVWEEEQRKAFEELKGNLTKQPILVHYDPKAETEVHCDASSSGLAGMMLQKREDQKWHLVYCVSKKTTEVESKYHSSKLELMAIVWTLTRLRQFLIGIKFAIVTDCQCLVYMNAKKSLNPQIARWFDLIQEYDFDVRHRPGQKMAHVDAMSRSPVMEPEDTLASIIEKKLEVCLTLTEEEQILMIQYSDPDLKKLIRIFQKTQSERTTDEKRMIDGYEFKKNRLFRRIKEKNQEKLLYVIPKSMRKSTTIKFHDLMGHFSVERTMSKIKELYWFSSMKRYVRRHISMCLECLMNKSPAGKQQGLLHPIKPGSRPFAIIHVDHLGPFVRSTRGNQELLVIIDNFTRFVRLTPVKNTSSLNVMKSLENFVNDFGLPDRIISDRGSCFTSEQFEKFCNDNGIRHTLNSTKHPQANGMVERANRTILSAITTCMENKEHKDWDAKIKQVERNLNNFVNKSSNKTPFEMLHGYSPRFNDGLLRRMADEDADSWTEPNELQDEARKRIEENQEKMKKYYDKKKCRTVVFEKGEIVVMKRAPKSTGQPTKTHMKYRGPLIVTEVFPSDTYRVTQLEAKEKGRFYTTTAHASQLKAWKCHPESDDEDDSDNDDATTAEPRRNPHRSTRKD